MFILAATPVLIATNFLGTVPDNPLSSGLRNALATMVPNEFKGYLDEFLAKYDLPTLSPASEIIPDSTETPLPLATTTVPPMITATLSPTPSPTPFPPTATPTMVVFASNRCVDATALYVRTGPGMGYPVIGWLERNTCLTVDGRAEGTNWVRISTGQPGYLEYGGMWANGYYLLPKDFELLPTVTTPPLIPR